MTILTILSSLRILSSTQARRYLMRVFAVLDASADFIWRFLDTMLWLIN